MDACTKPQIWLCHTSRLLFQPRACPELNPVARLWEHLKPALNWASFKTLAQLQTRVLNSWRSLTPEVITSLTGYPFILDALSALLEYRLNCYEFGIAGRRYFRKDNQKGVRTHHIHTFKVGSKQVERQAFQDYIIAHPEDAQRYSELKRGLAREYPTNIDGYMDGKDGFIREMDRKAAQWRTLPMRQQAT